MLLAPQTHFGNQQADHPHRINSSSQAQDEWLLKIKSIHDHNILARDIMCKVALDSGENISLD
jgi:hypothetical protein